MLRKRLGVSVSLGLLLILGATFLTGFVAAALDLNRFAYHKYAAYLAIALAAVHVVLHWRSLTGQVRRWLLGARAPTSPRVLPATGGGVAPRLSRRSILWPGVFLGAGVGLGHWWSSRGTAVALEEGEDLGQVYHQWSTPSYAGLLVKSVHARPQPSPYKEYPGAPTVPLPAIPAPGGPPLETVILGRRSVREYADRPLRLDELSRLLYYSTGITDRRDPTLAFRAVPSSGALFPTEVYPVLFNVEGVAPGVYHYDVQRHRLELVRAGDFRQEVFQAALSQEMILRASLVLVLTGLFPRVHWKYVDRSYRYLLLEAGHLGQNVYLAATALGLGPCGIGAFFDDQLNRLLSVDGRDEATVYLLAIGPTAT
ncbi:MAG: SagB/ThcOx family dehydrogenase [Chloroflexi bacterium]|nr:SagB/ThcOx family dehydrogenase [Chloroflexota bacterium]